MSEERETVDSELENEEIDNRGFVECLCGWSGDRSDLERHEIVWLDSGGGTYIEIEHSCPVCGCVHDGTIEN